MASSSVIANYKVFSLNNFLEHYYDYFYKFSFRTFKALSHFLEVVLNFWHQTTIV